LTADIGDSVEALKQQVHDKAGIPPDQQMLLFERRPMEDARTLAECGIQKDSDVHLLQRLWGNGERGR